MQSRNNGVLLRTPTVTKPHGGGWQDKLKKILAENNHKKSNSRGTASFRSQEARAERLFKCLETLRKDLHFGIEDPKNLKPRHVEKLVEHWIQSGLAASTIDSYLSALRTFAVWINKGGMVRSLAEYAPDLKRTYAATRDKSWTGNDVDIWGLWGNVHEKDNNVGLMLLLGMAFGARLAEMVRFKPLIHVYAGRVDLSDGAKGGRPRTVAIETEFQRAVVDVLQEHIKTRGRKPDGFIGDPSKTLKQNETRVKNVLTRCGVTQKKAGVTAHGLRAEFALEELQKRGLVATIRGGTGMAENNLKTKLAYLQVSERLGHSRISVMTAYSGPLRLSKAMLEKIAQSRMQAEQKWVEGNEVQMPDSSEEDASS